MNINLEEIQTRAYQLWEAAGRPAGRDEEFWLLAERGLMEKTESLRLETPMQSIAPESPMENVELETATATVTSPPLMNYS
jgi:Protein of unknown function (DUF2934)